MRRVASLMLGGNGMTAVSSDIDRLAQVLWERRKTLIGWTALGLALALAVLAMVPPLYSATTLLEVTAPNPAAPNATLSGPPPGRSVIDTLRVESEVELLRSSAVLAAAVAALDLSSDREFAGRTVEDTVQNLGDRLAVSRRASSAVIAIEARSRSAAKAARIANTVARVGAERRRFRMRDDGAVVAMAPPADLHLVSIALPPSRPRFPNWPLTLALAGILSLGFGALMALAMEARQGGFRAADEIATRFGIEAFAIDSPDPSASALPSARPPLGEGPGATREAWRRLCVGVARLLEGPGMDGTVTHEKRAPLLLVGAVRSTEGALAVRVALDLARTLAQGDRRVLLVDHDVVTPRLARLLDLRPRAGLQDLLVLSDQLGAASTVIVPDRQPGLDLLPARDGVAGDEAGLTRFDRLRSLLAAARGSYDIVISLGSPTRVMGEPIIRDATAMLLVIGGPDVPAREVAAAIAGLRAAALRPVILAAVLTQRAARRRLIRSDPTLPEEPSA